MMLMACLGYFVSDLMDIMPEWRKHKVELQRVCKAGRTGAYQTRVLRTCVGNQ
jgi:hypothetical protein